jgi:hypothetical protein
MTDELASYASIGKEFSNHSTVNHSADEYVRLGSFVHINTAECRFSLMKRAVFGTIIQLAKLICIAILPSGISSSTHARRLMQTACLSRYLALSENA